MDPNPKPASSFSASTHASRGGGAADDKVDELDRLVMGGSTETMDENTRERHGGRWRCGCGNSSSGGARSNQIDALGRLLF